MLLQRCRRIHIRERTRCGRKTGPQPRCRIGRPGSRSAHTGGQLHKKHIRNCRIPGSHSPDILRKIRRMDWNRFQMEPWDDPLLPGTTFPGEMCIGLYGERGRVVMDQFDKKLAGSLKNAWQSTHFERITATKYCAPLADKTAKSLAPSHPPGS
jgi:hypothetical protein